MKKIVAFLTGISFVFAACTSSEKPLILVASSPSVIDTFPGACPYLTKDNKGNTVLSWVRSINDSSAVFCYATSADGGKTFGKPVIIPSSSNVHPHAENMPKVIFKPSGEIIALWGSSNPNPKNKYSGLVFYAQSFDEGKTWSEAKQLVTDTAGFDQRYFDVALLSTGEAGIIWLDNRKKGKADGSALYFASTNGKEGFKNEKIISESCCQCCRTDLYIDSKDGIHALYRGIIADSVRDMVHTVSVDGGKTFAAPKRISNDNWVLKGCPHTGPAMIENKEGLHFAWYTGGMKKGSFFTSSKTNGNSFIGEDSISQLGRHPQLCVLPNENIITVWDEAVKNKKGTNSLIGLQLRSADGKSLTKEYITGGTTSDTYPVACKTGENASLIAYCSKRNDKTYIAYQAVRFQ